MHKEIWEWMSKPIITLPKEFHGNIPRSSFGNINIGLLRTNRNLKIKGVFTLMDRKWKLKVSSHRMYGFMGKRRRLNYSWWKELIICSEKFVCHSSNDGISPRDKMIAYKFKITHWQSQQKFSQIYIGLIRRIYSNLCWRIIFKTARN